MRTAFIPKCRFHRGFTENLFSGFGNLRLIGYLLSDDAEVGGSAPYYYFMPPTLLKSIILSIGFYLFFNK